MGSSVVSSLFFTNTTNDDGENKRHQVNKIAHQDISRKPLCYYVILTDV